MSLFYATMANEDNIDYTSLRYDLSYGMLFISKYRKQNKYAGGKCNL